MQERTFRSYQRRGLELYRLSLQKLICPSVGQKLGDLEMLKLPDAVMEGTVVSLDDGPDGDLFTVGLKVDAASRDISD